METFSQEMDLTLNLVNVYRPYLERVVFCEIFFSKSFLNKENVIIGGDLNFTLGAIEIWRTKAIIDPLSYFVRHHLAKGISLMWILSS